MNTLKDFVNWKLTHADKVAEAEGYPLIMENCKKNKRMKQLEIYGNSVQDGIPTPDNPIEVQSVGEPTVNLFDKDNHIKLSSWGAANIKITETGISFEVSNSGGNGFYMMDLGLASEYAGKTLTLTSTSYYSSTTTTVGIRDVNSNTTVLDGSKYKFKDGLYYSTLEVEDIYTDEHLFVRLYYASQELGSVVEYKDIMVAESDTPVEYEPYGKYKIPITIRGENLAQLVSVSANNYSSYSKNGNSYTIKGNVGTSEAGYDTGQLMIPHASENTISNSGISVQSGETYNISFDCLLQEIGKYNNHISLLIYHKYDGGGVGVYTKGECYPTIGVVTHYNITFTAPKTEKIGLCFRINNNLVTISNLRVENADIEPITTNIFLSEPLRKIGDYADYVDGKGGKVVRNIREFVVLSTTSSLGKNDWYLDKGWNAYRYTLKGVNLPYFNIYDTKEMCTHFLTTATYNSNNIVEYSFQMASTDVYFITTKASEETIADFKALLKSKEDEGNPVKLYYRLKTPIEEPITIDLPKLNAKTTVIEVDTSLAPSDAYGKYIKK